VCYCLCVCVGEVSVRCLFTSVSCTIFRIDVHVLRSVRLLITNKQINKQTHEHTHTQSGAILAAMTTSVPEAAHSGRNWDYRFCWLRDSFHTVQTLNRLGATSTMERYLR